MKRRWIQLASALIYNANLKGFGEAAIYQGKTKGVCVPGLNCYSCPGAIAACPLGTLQNALSSAPVRFPFLYSRLFDSFRIVPGENDLRLFVSLWIDSGIALQDPGAKIQEKPDNPDTFLAEIWNSCFVCDLYSTVFCLPERISTAVILQIYLSGGDAGRWTDIGSWQSVSTGGGRCAL